MSDDHQECPWELLHQTLPDVHVTFKWLRPGLMGYTRWAPNEPPRIIVANGLNHYERRVTVAHEAHHVMKGQPAPGPAAKVADELEVREETARWLLPDVNRMGTVVRRHGLKKAARRLRVTSDVLLDRIRWADQDALDIIAG